MRASRTRPPKMPRPRRRPKPRPPPEGRPVDAFGVKVLVGYGSIAKTQHRPTHAARRAFQSQRSAGSMTAEQGRSPSRLRSISRLSRLYIRKARTGVPTPWHADGIITARDRCLGVALGLARMRDPRGRIGAPPRSRKPCGAAEQRWVRDMTWICGDAYSAWAEPEARPDLVALPAPGLGDIPATLDRVFH